MTRFEAPRGTHDVLPPDQPLWERVIGEAERLSALYGYRRIQTPVFEDTALFARTSGEGSDVVQKEMYTFEDRGGRSLTLRPEGTAPNARAYLEHGLHREPQPVKTYMIATMYRYASPQRGRYREHWQWSVEAVGSDDPAVDAEIIHVYRALLDSLGVTQWTLELNSIGDSRCRPAYVAELTAWLENNDHLLDDEARQKRATNPLRVFDVKNPDVRAALAGAPGIQEFYCDECRDHFHEVREYLNAYGVRYGVEPRLVRGLDYYTRTTFEFVGPEGSAQSSICGGGRYDGLVEQIGGPPTAGIGFGAGIERLLLAVEAEGRAEAAEQSSIDVFFVLGGDAPRLRLLALMMELRRSGLSCDTDYAGRSLNGQVTQAKRLGARVVVIAAEEGATVRRAGEEDVVVRFDPLLEGLRREVTK